MSKRKYSKEFKLKVLGEHEEDDLARQNSNLCQYMAEFKKEVVLDYLSGGGSGQPVAVKPEKRICMKLDFPIPLHCLSNRSSLVILCSHL